MPDGQVVAERAMQLVDDCARDPVNVTERRKARCETAGDREAAARVVVIQPRCR
jgi:hypothetical protein